MKKITALATLCVATALLLAGGAVRAQVQGQPAAAKQVYNEQADARAELNLALARAQQQKKNVLVVFGANWCGDCMALSKKMSAGSLAEHVDQRFVVLKVDVGRFNRNTDLAAQMGVPLKKGIPAVAVLNRDGDVQSATGGGELADARNMGDDAVLHVFEGLHARP
ncbi:MAG: thioredoxin family protein [Burkholderiaceae bacterium]